MAYSDCNFVEPKYLLGFFDNLKYLPEYSLKELYNIFRTINRMSDVIHPFQSYAARYSRDEYQAIKDDIDETYEAISNELFRRYPFLKYQRIWLRFVAER